MHALLDRANAAILIAAPDPGSVAPPGSDKFLSGAGYVKWLCGLACVVGLCVVGATMAIQHRRGTGGEHGAALASVGAGSILLGVAAGLVTALGA